MQTGRRVMPGTIIKLVDTEAARGTVVLVVVETGPPVLWLK
jgi:hypothetical protein